MSFLYEDQGIEFDDVRVALVRLFGPGHRATIHDGDGCLLFNRVPGHYCAGTITSPSGATVATFAIDYIVDEAEDGHCYRQVTGIHVGPRGQWCRNFADEDRFSGWVHRLLCIVSSRTEAKP